MLRPLGICLVTLMTFPTTAASRPASAPKSRGLSRSPLGQIRRHVQAIDRRAATLQKVELWSDGRPLRRSGFRREGATAYLSHGQLCKAVVVGPKCCTAGYCVREYYFVDSRPIFVLETAHWYTYTKRGISPKIAHRLTFRTYFHGDKSVALPCHDERTVCNFQHQEILDEATQIVKTLATTPSRR